MLKLLTIIGIACVLTGSTAIGITVDQIVSAKSLIDEITSLKTELDCLDNFKGDEVSVLAHENHGNNCCFVLGDDSKHVYAVIKTRVLHDAIQAQLDEKTKALEKLGVK